MEELRQKAIMDEKAIYAKKGLEDGERKREEELKERMEELRQKAIMDEKATYAKGLEKRQTRGCKKNVRVKNKQKKQ